MKPTSKSIITTIIFSIFIGFSMMYVELTTSGWCYKGFPFPIWQTCMDMISISSGKEQLKDFFVITNLVFWFMAGLFVTISFKSIINLKNNLYRILLLPLILMAISMSNHIRCGLFCIFSPSGIGFPFVISFEYPIDILFNYIFWLIITLIFGLFYYIGSKINK